MFELFILYAIVWGVIIIGAAISNLIDEHDKRKRG